MRPADALTVHECDRPLIRVGRPNDGGYVIVDGLQYDHFLSGGISNENSFEIGILNLHPMLSCDAYDPSTGGGQAHPMYRFHQEPVGYLGLDDCRNALVKLDIERAEWPWLEGLTMAQLGNIAQLVMELHSPHVPEARWSWERLECIASQHVLIHAHGNNWDGIVEAGGARMPGTIECTWVRRDLVGPVRRNTRPIPSPLDQPNDPSKPDHVVDWEPFVWAVP